MSAESPSPWNTLMACCTGSDDAFIVAPYIKSNTLSRVLGALAPDARLTCVSRWTPRDIKYGATDLACRTLVCNKNGVFLLHNRLHAKYYRFGAQILLGSANLTGAGMNVGGSGNLEILCTAPAEFDAVKFEQAVLEEAYTVSDTVFAQWSEIQPTGPLDGPRGTRPSRHSGQLETGNQAP